ncbi:hypothetical protein YASMINEVIRUS_575 [Yasminevirus sp. GU-2018]|uniref:Uncharacterized protein n=1 Tax=Yasminevirus sp. GU-2018 TaxID=2420051 RepID=A0A5K0U9I6_9VIRU|nr:hypothetical protein YASMINEVIRUS_575 [Yasminevirus sp. GU-2018]
MQSNQDNIQERVVRILIFVLMNFIILRYLAGLELGDGDQLKIVAVTTLCFMFVNTYYPYVVTK